MSTSDATRARQTDVRSVELETMRAKLDEAEETLRAIRNGEADAVVVQGPAGPLVYTLATSDESWRTLVEQMSEGALILSLDGTILYANGRMCELVADATPAGKSLAELVAPESRGLLSDLLARAVEQDVSAEVRLARITDTPELPVHLSLSVLRTGGLTGLAGIVTDLSEQKRREEATEREQMTSAVLDFAGAAILVCDAHGEVMRANREALALCGEDPVGKQLEQVLPLGVAYDFLRDTTASKPLEAALVLPDGERFLNVSSRPIGRGAPRDGWWVVTVSDLTDRRCAEVALRKAKEAAEAANRAKSDFLSVMSHELRTPLNSVVGYSDLLIMGVDGELNDVQKRKLERIQTSARHQLSLIEEILTYARIEAGQDRLLLSEVDLSQLIRDVAAFVRPEAAGKGLDVDVTCPDDVHLVTDAPKLRRILINLAGNATKFTRDGTVKIQAGLESGWVHVAVRDTGPGIPEEFLERIWEPFTQVDPSPTRESKGTGLGLAIVKRLVEAMGGEIDVTTALGQGTTFTVRLPAAAVR